MSRAAHALPFAAFRVLVLVLVLVLALAACAGSARAPSDARAPAPPPGLVDAEVSRVLDDFHDAAARADEERYFGHFAEGGVFLGTDATERWTVPQFRAYAHPHFAKGKAWTFHAVRRAVHFQDGVAWFDEDLDTPHLGPARGSGTLVRDAKGGWKIAQYNLSIPIPNERFKDAKAAIEGAACAKP